MASLMPSGLLADDPESVIAQAARRLDEKHFPLSQVSVRPLLLFEFL